MKENWTVPQSHMKHPWILHGIVWRDHMETMAGYPRFGSTSSLDMVGKYFTWQGINQQLNQA